MADQLDNRPVFVIVMGCNGSGKSAWKRENYDRLPEHYLDQDSIAGGYGDWNSDTNRERTRTKVDTEINGYFAERLSWGIESTFSGIPGPAMMKRAIDEGYRIEGIYIGTNEPQINIARIRHRVRLHTGHFVDETLIPNRYRHSLSNLRKSFEKFDQLELFDNSTEDEIDHLPHVELQAILFEGKINLYVAKDELAPWCDRLLRRITEARKMREFQVQKEEAKRQRRDTEGHRQRPGDLHNQ